MDTSPKPNSVGDPGAEVIANDHEHAKIYQRRELFLKGSLYRCDSSIDYPHCTILTAKYHSECNQQ